MPMRVGALDAPLLQLSANDVHDLRAACNHQLILGTSGSGKSSTSYKQAVIAALKSSCGGLFCTAKPECVESIRRYCAQAGRSSSLIEIGPGQATVNMVAYEFARTGSINAVSDLLGEVFAICRESGTSPSKAGEQFWTDAPMQVIGASTPIVYAATGTVRMGDLLAFVRNAPESSAQLNDPAWRAQSLWAQMFDAAFARLADGPIAGFDAAMGQRAMDYWAFDFCRLDPKTQGNVRISVTTMLSRFESGVLNEVLCGETTAVPELMMSGGAVLLLNAPVQVYGRDGAILQKIVKLLAYRAILSRNAMPLAMCDRPLIVAADECQNFLHDDAAFLARCRSSLTMVVFATQSLPTLYATIGGDHPHDRVHHLVSNFNNIVLHSSACAETNEWFARKLGRTLHMRRNISQGEGGGQNFGANMGEGTNWGVNSSFGSSSSTGSGGSSSGTTSSSGSSSGGSDNWGRNRGRNTSWNTGESWAEQSDWVLEPGFFARNLLTGGTHNRGRVSAIWFRAGACFAATNSNFLMVEYQQ